LTNNQFHHISKYDDDNLWVIRKMWKDLILQVNETHALKISVSGNPIYLYTRYKG
jgi:hypothetical protein